MADAIRCINGADRLWTARERAELRRQEENDAKCPENEREVRRRQAEGELHSRTVVFASRPCAADTRRQNSDGC